jgi:hypothetical protein
MTSSTAAASARSADGTGDEGAASPFPVSAAVCGCVMGWESHFQAMPCQGQNRQMEGHLRRRLNVLG